MKKNRGFTLIEIGIVLFVVGILVAVFIPNFTQGIRDKTTAKKIVTQSIQSIHDVILIAQSCNKSNSDIVGLTGLSVLSSPPKQYSVLLSEGINSIDSAYQFCVTQSNVNLSKYRLSSMSPWLKIEGTPYVFELTSTSNYVRAKTVLIPYDIAKEQIQQLGLSLSDFPMGTVSPQAIRTIGNMSFLFTDLGNGKATTTLMSKIM